MLRTEAALVLVNTDVIQSPSNSDLDNRSFEQSKVGRSTVSDKGLSINLANYDPNLIFRRSINSRTDYPCLKQLAAVSFPPPPLAGRYFTKPLGA